MRKKILFYTNFFRYTHTHTAEKCLENLENQQNYSIMLLHLVGKDDVDSTIRIAGSIAFKNFVKRNWNIHVVIMVLIFTQYFSLNNTFFLLLFHTKKNKLG